MSSQAAIGLLLVALAINSSVLAFSPPQLCGSGRNPSTARHQSIQQQSTAHAERSRLDLPTFDYAPGIASIGGFRPKALFARGRPKASASIEEEEVDGDLDYEEDDDAAAGEEEGTWLC